MGGSGGWGVGGWVSGRVVGVVCCAAMGRGSEIGFCGWVGCDEWCVFGNGFIRHFEVW